MLSDFIVGAEKSILRYLIGSNDSNDSKLNANSSVRYFTKKFMLSDHFADLKCVKTNMSELSNFEVGPSVDDKKYDTGACSENAGNRCMSSTFSFGTTIREDIYMALLDAGDKFPAADKNKIRIMLDIHEKNDEWFSLSDRYVEDN